KRFLERIDDPEKNWKFSEADLKERARFEEYLDTYDEVITATASKHSPWYALPADQKWYTRYLVSEIVVDALEHCTHDYPAPDPAALDRLLDCKKALESE
ncbi:polyphosphate kinase 2 family protein, partial [bacterium]|nr:polyphosphate kinase 2 family protein [bacterium]